MVNREIVVLAKGALRPRCQCYAKGEKCMDSVSAQNQNTNSVIPKVLLIDLENCPNQLHNLPADLANYVQVVICYAQSASKIPLNWLNPLSTAIAAQKLKIQKMERSGKNSADFGICFYAGVLMQKLPKETHFVIVSNDTDLDHVVHLLKSHGRPAERLGTSQKEKEKPKPAPSGVTPLALYCAHLTTHSKNRPSKASTLLNSIKNKFKDNPAIANLVYKNLVSNGAIKITNNKVTYNDQKISALANT
jgi:hypothetical protein